VLIGDTEVEAFLEKFVGYMGGFISLALGLVRWMPSVQRLTEEISQREEAEATAVQALEANSAKSKFLAVMSHEIRTPMNGVLGMTDLISRTNITAEQREYVDVLKESGQSLMTLLNDILDLSKIEAGHIELEKRDFSIRALLDSTEKLWSHGAQDKGLTFSIENSLVELDVVRADRNRLRQVLNNLIGNAIKFTADGYIELRVKEVPRADELVEIRFEIHDTGLGIPEEQTEEIFRPFTQADSSTTRNYGGTGLGLPICKNLVELLGGEIGLARKPDTGSVFWFTVVVEHGNAEEIELGLSNADPALSPVQANDRRLHILVAEDNPLNQTIVSWMLASLDCQVDIVTNGLEAIAAVNRSKYDLVLMDVQMPEMDGVAATKQIRSLEGAVGKVPIIAMTANAMQGDRERYLDMGMTDYVSKPIDQRELLYVISCQANVTMPELNEQGSKMPSGNENYDRSFSKEDKKDLDELMGDLDSLLDGTNN